MRNIIKRGSAIYFLFKERELIYIGASKRFPTRLASHYTKNYDTVRYIYVHEDILKASEKRLIQYFKPRLNIRGYDIGKSKYVADKLIIIVPNEN